MHDRDLMVARLPKKDHKHPTKMNIDRMLLQQKLTIASFGTPVAVQLLLSPLLCLLTAHLQP